MPVAVALSLAPGHRAWWWTAALVTGYLLAVLAGPTRDCLRDGLRAMGRYRELWLIPTVLGWGYTTWQLALRGLLSMTLPEPDRPVWAWWEVRPFPSEAWYPLLHGSVLPAVELTAGLSTVFFTTYPVSVLAALLFLVNGRGVLCQLTRALRQRYGGWGVLLGVALLVCALAALAKPLLYVALARWDGGHTLAVLRMALVIDWLSFVFQMLLGTGLQTYLILLAYLWVRGRNFTREQLTGFAVRRFSVVLRWAGPVLLLSSLLLHGSYFLLTIEGPAAWMGPGWLTEMTARVTRPCLAVLLLVFFTVQMSLIFHSTTLRTALRHNFRFLRRHWFAMLFLVSLAFFHFFALTVAGEVAETFCESGSLPGMALLYLRSLLLAMTGGWLLASWASLYHRLSPVPAERKRRATELP